MISSSSYCLISGGTGVGKTQLALQLGICIAAPMPFLNFNIEEQKKVAYVSVEMSHGQIAWFLRQMVRSISVKDLAFRVLPIGQTVSILTEEAKNFYRQLAENYDVIIIDTLGASTHTALSDEDAARVIVDFFNELTLLDKTVIVVHHDAKNTTGSRTENVYGSRLFGDRARTVLRMHKDRNDKSKAMLEFSKISLAREPDDTLLERTEDLWYVSSDTPSTPTMNVRGLDGKRKSKSGVDSSSLF